MEWRPIPGFPGYAANALGQIRGRRHGRIMTPKPDAYGYPSVSLWCDARQKPVAKPVHRLVALAWLGEPPSPSHQVAHNDGTRTNNAVSNLRWATAAENNADMDAHGTRRLGERHANAKLTTAAVRAIRAARAAGRPRQDTAAEFGVSYFTVAKIDTGRRWKHVEAAE